VRIYATGEILNELSVLTAQVSLSSVTAQAPSESLLVSQSAIDALVTEAPKLAAKLFRHFAKLVIYRMVPVHAMPPSQTVPQISASLPQAC
jgi:CRP-like cAMP-binding protein